MQIKIGPIQVNNNVILAPMSGVTDMPYRKIAKEYGVGLVISEMIATEKLGQEVSNKFANAKTTISQNLDNLSTQFNMGGINV